MVLNRISWAPDYLLTAQHRVAHGGHSTTYWACITCTFVLLLHLLRRQASLILADGGVRNCLLCTAPRAKSSVPISPQGARRVG